MRSMIVQDIGRGVKELEVADFLDTFTPKASVSSQDAEERLREGPKPKLADDGWQDFRTPPKSVSAHEDIAYKEFPKVVNAIIDTGPEEGRNFAYTQMPNSNPLHTLRKVSVKPDGYGYILRRDGDPQLSQPDIIRWRQIVLCAEFKKSDTSPQKRNEVSAQLSLDRVSKLTFA